MNKMYKKKIKNIFVTTVVFCGFVLVLAGCGNNIKKQMEKAMNDFNSGHYSEAKEDFNMILKEDSSNSEANLIVSIIDNFENAKKLYENKEYDKSNEEISKIPGEYNKYNIKSDVDDLKENINKNLDEIKQIDNKMNELSNLIDDGKLDDASKKINEFKDKELTEIQNKNLTDLNDKLNKKIEQKKDEEKNTQNKEVNYINTEENAIKKVSSVKEIKDLIEKGIKITYLPSKDIINNKDGIKVDVGENKEKRGVFNWHYFVDYNGEVYKLNIMSDKYEKIN
ncbi:hypothetical protein [Clostridium perfringens]|uniref:hypothetical protein n=1 Tax=Clostridium perfringens TaxID=1502 RepID=UPI000F520EE7|nr:hypothetical protein [Clostridium perfringens]